MWGERGGRVMCDAVVWCLRCPWTDRVFSVLQISSPKEAYRKTWNAKYTLRRYVSPPALLLLVVGHILSKHCLLLVWRIDCNDRFWLVKTMCCSVGTMSLKYIRKLCMWITVYTLLKTLWKFNVQNLFESKSYMLAGLDCSSENSPFHWPLSPFWQ